MVFRRAAMEFWPEFLASSGGREFVAGGVGGMAGVLAGHPLDTLRIRLQQPSAGHPGGIAAMLRGILRAQGPAALYRGMSAPLASVTFQNAMVFQVYAILSRSLDSGIEHPPSYTSVALAGVGTGALQTVILSPVELVKIRLQLDTARAGHAFPRHGPIDTARDILRKEGVRGIYRGLTVTALRDAPAHGVYFWTYEYARERLRLRREEDDGENQSLATMLVAGGLAGVASWVCSYPLDVVKSRLQAQTPAAAFPRYRGIVDCFRKSVREEGLPVLWRGLGTAVARAFLVNGAIFAAYELSLKFLASRSCSGNEQRQIVMEEN